MLLNRSLSILTLAVAAALPLALSTTAVAQQQYQQQYQQGALGIATFGVEQVDRLRPGEELAFRLDGAPGAQVTLQIAGITRPVQMSEVSPGRYEGQYTIRQRDRLTASTTVTAKMVKYGRSTSASLGQSLLAGGADPVATAPSQINSFSVNAPERVRPGDELRFSLAGTPGGQASVAVQGVAKRIPLTEVRPGVYEGSHVMRRGERVRNGLVADAYLMSNRRETSLRYTAAANGQNGDQRGVYNGEQRGGYNSDQRPVVACLNCGSVVSVNLVDVKGDAPNVIGTIAGGLLGGVIGNQVGGGSGKDLATIAGAIGGAYAGNRVENNMDKKQVYRVSVRLDNGTTRSFDYAESPGLSVGARVKVENDALARL